MNSPFFLDFMKAKMELYASPQEEEQQENRIVGGQKIATKNKVVTMMAGSSSCLVLKVDTLMNHHQGSLINFQQGVYLGEDTRTTKMKKNNKEKVVDPYAGVETPPPTNLNYFSSSEEEYFSALEDEEDDEDHDKEMETKPKKKRTLTFSCIGSRKKKKARKH